MSSGRGLVIDASAAADLLRPGAAGEAVARAVEDGELHAPDLIDVEVPSAIARWERAGETTAPHAARSLGRYARLPIERHPGRSLIGAVWDLRRGVRIADAYYIALAQALDVALITTDLRLGRACREQSLCDVMAIG
ncbi:type II toxin-antitoxin system VapC family toxin [Nocardioides humi]|uniref:Ribonuclease VapC n=1 Tax=Nocardioides humi TaxID=449461 RepID=A0ABN2ANB1_9ACTN|nr:type II toxin-antitoxin system VapC family toxin [Nocardioides humi]